MSSQFNSSKRVKIVLAFVRCGNYFTASRYIASGRYQLIYDADRIPALSVLADEYKGKLDCFFPLPTINPMGGFLYNSITSLNINSSLSATEHLEKLSAKYSASPGFELFNKIMSLQDNGNKCLLSVFGFPYTHRYPTLNLDFRWVKDFDWTIEHAAKALRLLHKWFAQSEYEADFLMIMRRIPDWIESRLLHVGKSKENRDIVFQRLSDMPIILKTCQDINIPIFWLHDVIKEMNNNNLDFENSLVPVQSHEVDEISDNLEEYARYIKEFTPRNRIRITRLIQYMSEKNPIKRISLVRSIGKYPLMFRNYIPFLRKRIQEDTIGLALNNAKIKKIV